MILTEDKKVYLSKEIKNAMHTLHYLSELVNTKDIEENMRDTMMTVLENHIIDFNDILERSSNLNQERDKKYKEIKNRNIRINELEKQLADLTLDKIDENYFPYILTKIKNYLYDNYKREVNCIIKTIIINEYTVEIEVTPMIAHYSNSFSKTPASDKEEHNNKIKQLQCEGFELNDKLDLNLTDKNISLLEDKMLRIIPGAKTKSIKNWTYKKENIITSITFLISVKELINAIK